MKTQQHYASGGSTLTNGDHNGRNGTRLRSSVEVGLSPAIVADPTLHAKRRAYADGETIVDHQAPATHVYFVHRGQVRLFHDSLGQATPVAENPNNTRLVSILGQDDWFGTAALAARPTMGMRAVAHGSSVVSTVSADRLMDALADKPETLLALTRDLAGKLEDARVEASNLLFDDCQRRLIRQLVTLAKSAAATAFSDGSIELRITHHQIAQAIGVARETVSLSLGEMRSRGLLTTGRNRVTFMPSDLNALL